MLGIKSGQIDIFDHMIYERLVPKDHILVKIASIIDFSFVYDMVNVFGRIETKQCGS